MLNTIQCGDCVSIMNQLPDNYIDLTVTSPPYDNLRTYNGYSFNYESIAQELYRITKPGGVVIWVVGDGTVNGSESGTSFRQALYFKEIGFNLHDTMIYEKGGFANPSSTRYHQTFEYMFVFTKGSIKTFNAIKDRPNKYEKRGGSNTRQSDGTFRERKGGQKLAPFGQRFNVWRYAIGKSQSTKDTIAYKHPAIFPEQLAYDHIISWSNEYDIVFDPMCGSGTTLKMAKQLCRNYIGIDISEEYCEIARQRVNSA